MQTFDITPGTRPRRDEQVDWSPFGDDLVLFQKISKQYFVLNTIARRIWELSDGRTPVDAIAQALEREFGLPRERAAADARETVGGLAELGILAL